MFNFLRRKKMSEADNQVAAQNAEAANANPTQGPADTALTSGAVGGPNTGNASGQQLPADAAANVNAGSTAGSQMYIGSGVDLTAAAKAAAVSELAATPATATEDDEHLLDVLEMYVKAGELRFKHLLTGMENSTSAMLKHLKDAMVHLKDHIEGQQADATKEETNV